MKPCVKYFFHVIYIMDDIFCKQNIYFISLYSLSTVVIILCDGQFII
jgi:hypothetical protein